MRNISLSADMLFSGSELSFIWIYSDIDLDPILIDVKQNAKSNFNTYLCDIV